MGIKKEDQSSSGVVEDEEEPEIPTGYCPGGEAPDELVEAEEIEGGYGCPVCGRVLSEDSLQEARDEFWNHAANTRFK